MNNNIPTDYVSKNDEKYSALCWKSVPKNKKERVRRNMVKALEYGSKRGLLFECPGHDDFFGNYITHRELTKQDQYTCSAYRVLAREISNKNTKYLIGRFDFDKKQGIMRAPVTKVSLSEKVENYESDSSSNSEFSGNFGSPLLPSYLEKLAFFRIKYNNLHKK